MSEATSGASNCGLRVYMHLRRERLPPEAREGGLCPEGCHLVFPHLAGPKKGPPLVPTGPGDDAQEHSTTVPLQPGSPASISPSRGPHLVTMGTEEVKAGLNHDDADLLRE